MAELRVKSTGTLKLFESDNTSSVTIASPASLGADRTVTLPDGDVTLVAGTMSTGGVALTGSTNNTVTTVTGADAIQGETNFIYDGTIVGAGADGANAALGTGVHIKTSDTGGAVQTNGDNLVLEENGNVGIQMLSATNGTGHIFFGNSGDTDEGFITYDADNNRMRFGVVSSERMRIDSSGRVLVGTTSVIDSNAAFNIKYVVNYPLALKVDATGNTAQVSFWNGNGHVGSILTNGTATSYSTSSDYRLKENVDYDFDATTRLKQLKPSRFNFKTDASKTVDGFLAHEVSEIIPEAITGIKDATETKQNIVLNANGTMIYNGVLEQDYIDGKANGNYPSDSTWIAEKEVPVYQSIDESKLVPLLVKSLQEAITKIETLEAKVTALENA